MLPSLCVWLSSLRVCWRLGGGWNVGSKLFLVSLFLRALISARGSHPYLTVSQGPISNTITLGSRVSRMQSRGEGGHIQSVRNGHLSSWGGKLLKPILVDSAILLNVGQPLAGSAFFGLDWDSRYWGVGYEVSKMFGYSVSCGQHHFTHC